MEKLCSRCGTKFVGNIDLLSGDFAATGLDQYQKTFIRVYYKNCLCPEQLDCCIADYCADNKAGDDSVIQKARI